jgi:hypothetical protein
MNVIRHKKEQMMLFEDHHQLDETIQIIKFTNNTLNRPGNNITMDLSATHGKETPIDVTL